MLPPLIQMNPYQLAASLASLSCMWLAVLDFICDTDWLIFKSVNYSAGLHCPTADYSGERREKVMAIVRSSQHEAAGQLTAQLLVLENAWLTFENWFKGVNSTKRSALWALLTGPYSQVGISLSCVGWKCKLWKRSREAVRLLRGVELWWLNKCACNGTSQSSDIEH